MELACWLFLKAQIKQASQVTTWWQGKVSIWLSALRQPAHQRCSPRCLTPSPHRGPSCGGPGSPGHHGKRSYKPLVIQGILQSMAKAITCWLLSSTCRICHALLAIFKATKCRHNGGQHVQRASRAVRHQIHGQAKLAHSICHSAPRPNLAFNRDADTPLFLGTAKRAPVNSSVRLLIALKASYMAHLWPLMLQRLVRFVGNAFFGTQPLIVFKAPI